MVLEILRWAFPITMVLLTVVFIAWFGTLRGQPKLKSEDYLEGLRNEGGGQRVSGAVEKIERRLTEPTPSVPRVSAMERLGKDGWLV